MKIKASFFIFVFTFLVCSVFLYADGKRERFSVPEDAPSIFKNIDKESFKLAEEIGKKVSALSSSGKVPVVQVSQFLFDEGLSVLGDLWEQNLRLFLGNKLDEIGRAHV